MDAVRSQVHQAEKSREAELLTVKATNRDVQRQLVEKTRSLSRKNKEVDDLKTSYEAQVGVLERKYNEEMGMYRKRSSESDRLARDLELMKSEGDKQGGWPTYDDDWTVSEQNPIPNPNPTDSILNSYWTDT